MISVYEGGTQGGDSHLQSCKRVLSRTRPSLHLCRGNSHQFLP